MRKERRERPKAARIADQLRRAFDGSAWHGPALLELLEDVDAATAAAKPLPNVHSIWELVLHIAVWDDAGLRRLSGKKWQPTGLANFPPVTLADGSGVAQGRLQRRSARMMLWSRRLRGCRIRGFGDRVSGQAV